MKLLLIVSIGLLAAVDGAARGRRALQAMDAFSLQSFTQLFRETLLNKIALEMNNTVDMSRDLKVKMDACKVQVTAKTDQCKSAAQSACQADPSFMDYLNAGANLVNPYTYLEGPFNDMASKVGDAVDLLGDKANGFLNSVKDLGGSAVGGVYDGFSSAFNGFKDQLSSLGNSILGAGNTVIDTANLIGDGFTDLGSSIGNVGTDIGHSIGNIGSSIGHAIGGIFGRRELDAQTRQCMEKCAPCRPLLLPTQSDIITSVCGPEIVNTNKTIQDRVGKLQRVYDATLDKIHPIITKVEFDPSSMNAQMQLANVHITVRLNGRDQSYKTAVPYSMMNLPTTAHNMAMEFWGKSH